MGVVSGGINMEKEIEFTKKDIMSISFSKGYMYQTITFSLKGGKHLRVNEVHLMRLFRANSTKKFKAKLKRSYYHLEE